MLGNTADIAPICAAFCVLISFFLMSKDSFAMCWKVFLLYRLALNWIVFKDSAFIAQYTHSILIIKSDHLMLHREIVTIFPAIRTKHINTTLYWQNVGFLILNILVHKETSRFCKISLCGHHLIMWEPKTRISSCVLVAQFCKLQIFRQEGAICSFNLTTNCTLVILNVKFKKKSIKLHSVLWFLK